MPIAADNTRLHAFDQLRALAMLGGVLFHAAMAHSVLVQPFWPGALGTTSWWVDAAAWLSHLVRMPLFFLVAGYFAAHTLARRGMAGLFRQRARRVLVPFLVAWPLLTLALASGLGWAAQHVDAPNAVLRYLREASGSEAPALPVGLGHLWFLPYLLLFTTMHWAGKALGAGAWLEAAMARGPVVVAVGLPMVLIAPFAMTSAPHPAPEGLLPQLWAIGLYGPFFALGVGLHGRLDDWATLWRRGWPALAVVLALHVVFLWRLQQGPLDALWPHAAWPTAALEAGIAAWGTLLLVIAGLRFLQQPSPALGYLARSAYTVYLVHLPLLLALQIALLGRGLSGPAAFAIVVTGTLAGSLLIYELGVRRTPLRRWIG
ncbi:MAG: acyltransferase family protein [Lysobacteraceae bacterium]